MLTAQGILEQSEKKISEFPAQREISVEAIFVDPMLGFCSHPILSENTDFVVNQLN